MRRGREIGRERGRERGKGFWERRSATVRLPPGAMGMLWCLPAMRSARQPDGGGASSCARPPPRTPTASSSAPSLPSAYPPPPPPPFPHLWRGQWKKQREGKGRKEGRVGRGKDSPPQVRWRGEGASRRMRRGFGALPAGADACFPSPLPCWWRMGGRMAGASCAWMGESNAPCDAWSRGLFSQTPAWTSFLLPSLKRKRKREREREREREEEREGGHPPYPHPRLRLAACHLRPALLLRRRRGRPERCSPSLLPSPLLFPLPFPFPFSLPLGCERKGGG